MRSQHHSQLTQTDILKKLQQCGVRTQTQYKQIVSNLDQQSKRLLNQITSLKQSVLSLKQKQRKKNIQIKKEKQKPENIYQQTKQELQKKYKEFDYLRKKLEKKKGSEPLNIQFKQYINKCYVIDKQIFEIRSQLKDLRKQKRSISKGVKISKRQDSVKTISAQILQDQNKQYKRRIWQLKRITDQQQNQVLKVQNSLVGNRQKVRRNIQIAMTLGDLKQSRTLDRSQIIRNQVESHRVKTQIYHDQQRIVVDKNSNDGRYSKMSKASKINSVYTQKNMPLMMPAFQTNNLEKQKQILNNKNKLLLKYLKGFQSTKANLLDQLYQITQVLKEKQKPKTYVNQFCQTFHVKAVNDNNLKNSLESDRNNQKQQQQENNLDIYDDYQNPLRRQYFGRQGIITFDDRKILQYDKKTCITGLQIYQNQKGVSYIKAFYSNGKNSQDYLPIAYLEKIKCFKIELSPGDFVTIMAIKFHKKERRIVGLKIISNEDQKYEFNNTGNNIVSKKNMKLLKTKPKGESQNQTQNQKDQSQKGQEQDDSNQQQQQQQGFNFVSPNQEIYVFDIDTKEWPVCLFGSCVKQGYHWLLSSLGMQISQ